MENTESQQHENNMKMIECWGEEQVKSEKNYEMIKMCSIAGA